MFLKGQYGTREKIIKYGTYSVYKGHLAILTAVLHIKEEDGQNLIFIHVKYEH